MRYPNFFSFALGTSNDYAEELETLNAILNPLGVSFKIQTNQYGNFLCISIETVRFRIATNRRAGRKPKILKTDDTELRSRVEEIGLKAVAEEEEVSEKTIRRRLKKWS